MDEFFESADVARERGVTPEVVRRHAKAGRLRVAARTARGGRLYRAEDVQEYIRLCEDRALARSRKGRAR